MRKTRKYIPFLMLLLAFTFNSCSDDTTEESQSLIPNDLFSDADFNLDFTKTYDLNKFNLDDLIFNHLNELYQEDLVVMKNGVTQQYAGFDLSLNGNVLTIIPIGGSEPIQTNGDNEKCGGKSGDGWTLNETCHSEDCVRTAAAEVAAELSTSLKSGQCMDIRIKRNTLSARVCSRVVSC